MKIKNIELKSASRTGQQGDEGSGGLVGSRPGIGCQV